MDMEYLTTLFGHRIPRMTMRAQAVDRAEAELVAGKDWQEVEHELFNGIYAPLFTFHAEERDPDEIDHEDAMDIIHEAEERLGL